MAHPRLSLCSLLIALALFAEPVAAVSAEIAGSGKPRVIVTTDGEADDRCSMVRFLLTANEFQVEGIINTSSQFHWKGGTGWHAFHPPEWVRDYIGLYAQVYENLRLHDPAYPSPEYLLSKWRIGNIDAVGEDRLRTEGAELIARVLLDESDPRPVWVQAWGGCNTIARALRIVQEEHPDEMRRVADKLRLYLIWEQDGTYQSYIRPNWERFQIPTIIADQFDCMAYIWPKVLPAETKAYFGAEWMGAHILNGRGPLCSAYEHKKGAFQAEGDTPAFLHAIPNGLRSLESPAWGGWGGRFVRVRENVWMDPLPGPGFQRPEGQWGIDASWSKKLEKVADPASVEQRTRYFEPIWRWLGQVQNEFAARADWCVKDYAHANHPPVVRLKDTLLDIDVVPGTELALDATPTTDPDGDALRFRWWHYRDAGTYAGDALPSAETAKATLRVPGDARPGDEFHLICEVTDAGSPPLVRYQRVVVRVRAP